MKISKTTLVSNLKFNRRFLKTSFLDDHFCTVFVCYPLPKEGTAQASRAVFPLLQKQRGERYPPYLVPNDVFLQNFGLATLIYAKEFTKKPPNEVRGKYEKTTN